MPKKRGRIRGWLVLLLLLIIGLWLIKPLLTGLFIKKEPSEELLSRYAGEKVLLLVDRTSDEILLARNEEMPHLPASLAKLFLVDYASSLCSLDEEVLVRGEVLAYTPANASTAHLEPRTYHLEDIMAAILLPSGCDAAYVLAEYVGAKLAPEALTPEQRIQALMTGLRNHMDERGFSQTQLTNPSGYDLEARTTAWDLKILVDHLLELDWFRGMVSQESYLAYLPDGSYQAWENSNLLVKEGSAYYHPQAKGLKTGTLAGAHNIIALYEAGDREYLVISLGSATDEERYEDVQEVFGWLDSRKEEMGTRTAGHEGLGVSQ